MRESERGASEARAKAWARRTVEDRPVRYNCWQSQASSKRPGMRECQCRQLGSRGRLWRSPRSRRSTLAMARTWIVMKCMQGGSQRLGIVGLLFGRRCRARACMTELKMQLQHLSNSGHESPCTRAAQLHLTSPSRYASSPPLGPVCSPPNAASRYLLILADVWRPDTWPLQANAQWQLRTSSMGQARRR